MQAGRNLREFRRGGVKKKVSFEPGHDARDDQHERSALLLPELPVSLTRYAGRQVPIRKLSRVEHLVAQAVRDGNLNIMLIRRQHPAAVYELLQDRCRVVLATVKHRAHRGVPAAGVKHRAFRIEDRVGPVRIANPIGPQRPIKLLRAHQKALSKCTGLYPAQYVSNQTRPDLVLQHQVNRELVL